MTRIIRNPRVIWDVVDGVMTLCHLGSTEIYSLNETGAAVWEACDDTPEAILSRVREQYPDRGIGDHRCDCARLPERARNRQPDTVATGTDRRSRVAICLSG